MNETFGQNFMNIISVTRHKPTGRDNLHSFTLIELLVGALPCAAGLVLPCVQAQQADADTNQLAVLLAMAEKGDALAQSKLADAYFIGRLGVAENQAEAVRWLRKAAAQNFANAQLNLGNCYWRGQGVDKDVTEAMKWYRKAAEQNVPEAQYNLGVGYRDGQGVPKDEGEMVKWYRRAAEQNYADAQYNLGVCYASGQGLTTNYVEAVKWFRRAAEQNLALAQYNLGNNYVLGLGVKVDEAEGVKWLRKAAEQGLDDAQYKLGLCLAYGRGVTQDYVDAYAWFSLAAKGDAHATKLLDDLSKAMSPEQIAAGYRRTRELRAEIETKLKSSGK
jgi:TPR repeat protein